MPPLFKTQLLISLLLNAFLGGERLCWRRVAVRWLIRVHDSGIQDAGGLLVPETLDEQVAAVEEVALGVLWFGGRG